MPKQATVSKLDNAASAAIGHPVSGTTPQNISKTVIDGSYYGSRQSGRMSWVRFAGPLKAYLRRYSTAAGIPSSRETSRPVSGIRPREFSARVCDALHREPTRRLPVRRQHNRPPGADHTRISIPERHLVRFTKQLTTFASGTITRDQETCIPERLKRYHRSRPSAPRARRRAWAGPDSEPFPTGMGLVWKIQVIDLVRFWCRDGRPKTAIRDNGPLQGRILSRRQGRAGEGGNAPHRQKRYDAVS